SAQAALEGLERQKRLATLYAQGRRYRNAGQWDRALEQLEECERLEPGYADVRVLLSQVRQERAKRETPSMPTDQSTMQSHPEAQADETSETGTSVVKVVKEPVDTETARDQDFHEEQSLSRRWSTRDVQIAAACIAIGSLETLFLFWLIDRTAPPIQV